MIDRNVIGAKLAELDKRVRRIVSLRKQTESEYRSDETATELTAFNLMLAVQATVDLGAHLIADNDWPPALSSAEIFDRLREQGIVPQDLSRRLQKAVGFRNAIAHGYAQLRTDLLHRAATSGVDDLTAFSQHVASWVAQQP